MRSVIHYVTHWVRTEGKQLAPGCNWDTARCVRSALGPFYIEDISKRNKLCLYLEDVPCWNKALEDVIRRKLEVLIGSSYEVWFICDGVKRGVQVDD